MLGLLQFCFNLTAVKKVNIQKQGYLYRFMDFLFSTEAWSIVLVSYLQDLPSLILRLYIICVCGFFVHPTLYFFIIKNVLMIILQTMQFKILYREYKELKKEARKNCDQIDSKKKKIGMISKLFYHLAETDDGRKSRNTKVGVAW